MDVEPEIRAKSIVLATEVLTYYPELRTKRFFKTMFENSILDSNNDIVLITLKSLGGMITDKTLQPFVNKFWKDNTKVLIQLCLTENPKI